MSIKRARVIRHAARLVHVDLPGPVRRVERPVGYWVWRWWGGGDGGRDGGVGGRDEGAPDGCVGDRLDLLAAAIGRIEGGGELGYVLSKALTKSGPRNGPGYTPVYAPMSCPCEAPMTEYWYL